jgi:hypothetical protein
VVYRPGDVPQALYVMKYLSGAVMMEQSSTVAPGTVEVDLGTVVNVAAKAVPPPTTVAVTTTTVAGVTTTTVAATTSTSAPATTTTTTSEQTTTTRPAATTTTVPTPNGMPVNSPADEAEPWDPRACPS